MSAISKVLVQLTHLDIFDVNLKTEIDVKGWVANQSYFIDNDLDSGSFDLRVKETNTLKAALANDCNRMSAAAIESIAGISTDIAFKNSGAWGIIRTYYATFFAIHSIMRMFGKSCSQLENDHVNKIYESAAIMGKTGGLRNLDKGFYAITITNNYKTVTFKKYKDSHRDTWGEFLMLIDDLILKSSTATTIAKYKAEIYELLIAIKKGITRSRCTDKGNWLSQIRNSVNYQHSLGVWHPYPRKVIAPQYIKNIKTQWRKPISEQEFDLSGDDVDVFFKTSLLILSLFKELLFLCAEKVNNPHSKINSSSVMLLKTLPALE